MPAMMASQLINRCPRVAGAARSYGVTALNLMGLGKGGGTNNLTTTAYAQRGGNFVALPVRRAIG